jgi:hypothetical protein
MKIFSTFAVGLAVVALPQQVVADDVPAYEMTAPGIEESGDGNSSFLETTIKPDDDITKAAMTYSAQVKKFFATYCGAGGCKMPALPVWIKEFGESGRELYSAMTENIAGGIDKLGGEDGFGLQASHVDYSIRSLTGVMLALGLVRSRRTIGRWLNKAKNTVWRPKSGQSPPGPSTEDNQGPNQDETPTVDPNADKIKEQSANQGTTDVADVDVREPTKVLPTSAAAGSEQIHESISTSSTDGKDAGAGVTAVSQTAHSVDQTENEDTNNKGEEKKPFWNKGMIAAVVCGSVALIVGVIVLLARCNSSDSKMGSRMEDSDSDEERAPALASGAGPTSGQSNPRSGSQ